MSIQQTKKQSDLEKRLKLLRQQVYGRSESKMAYQSTNASPNRTNTATTDLAYLYQDLLKIALLSSAALGVQIIIYFLLQNHVLKLNLF